MGSLTPDERCFITSAYMGNKRFGILRFDLREGTREVIWEQGEDTCNAHPQVEPGGTDVMIQHNRGTVLDDAGRSPDPVDTVVALDVNG